MTARSDPPTTQNGPLLFLKHQSMDITGAMNHTHDDDFRIRKTVIQHVIAVEVCPQPLGQIIPARADLRLGKDSGKALFNLPDKLRSGATVVLCNETPDID